MFRDEREYMEVCDVVLQRLELDPSQFGKGKSGKRVRTPSPIKRIADSHSIDYNRVDRGRLSKRRTKDQLIK